MNNYAKLHSKFGKEYKNKAIEVQTAMLLDYAPKTLSYINASREAGITTLDKNYTGNLQDSFVWAVFYNGKLKGKGFVTPDKTARVAEHDKDYNGAIWGRKLAKALVDSYDSNVTNGWEVIWASAVNYAAKLEKGMADPKHLYGREWRILSQAFDMVDSDFKGRAKISISM